MSVTAIGQKFEFDSGHRVLGHGGKCRHLHGHRYVAEVILVAENLNALGMVIDFGDVKRIIGTWINEHWDHNMILNREDPLCSLCDVDFAEIFERPPFVMPSGMNPTAENMAEVLYFTCDRLLKEQHADLFAEGSTIAPRIEAVTLWETPNCRAIFQRSQVDAG